MLHSRLLTINAGNASDDSLAQELGEPLAQTIDRLKPQGQVGVFLARKNGKVALAVAAAKALPLAALSMVPPADGVVVVEGALTDEVRQLLGFNNRGRYGVGECERDPKVKLPRFRVVCRVDPTDRASWIELGSFKEHRILGDAVVQLVVWPKGLDGSSVFESASYVEPESLDAAKLGQQLTAALNRVRQQANLRPVTLAEAQSKTLDALTPRFYAARLGQGEAPEAEQDRLALAAIAGWDVGATVTYGGLTGVMSIGARDVNDLLAPLLLSPNYRRVLLDAEVATVALGTQTHVQGQAHAVLACGYQLLESTDWLALERSIVDRLNAQRAQRGLPPVEWVALPEHVTKEVVARLGRGEEDPESATDFLLHRYLEEVNRNVWGGYGLMSELERLEFSKDLLELPKVALGVTVGSYQPKGHPWTRYVVMYVYMNLAPDEARHMAALVR